MTQLEPFVFLAAGRSLSRLRGASAPLLSTPVDGGWRHDARVCDLGLFRRVLSVVGCVVRICADIVFALIQLGILIFNFIDW